MSSHVGNASLKSPDHISITSNGLDNEGEEVNWNTIHFNTYELHDLTISYDEGQDYINIDHTILIQYSAIESSPTV